MEHRFCALLMAATFCCELHAEVFTGIETSATNFHGEWDDDSNVGYGAHALAILSDERLRLGIAFDLSKSNGVIKGERFAFDSGTSVEVLTFFMVAMGCYGPTALFSCLGIGQGTMNVNSPDEQRDFGTWNYHWLTYLSIGERFRGFIHGRYVGQVEIRTKGRDANLGFKSLGLGIGYLI